MQFNLEAKYLTASIALTVAVAMALNAVLVPAVTRDLLPWSLGFAALALLCWLWAQREATSQQEAHRQAKAAEEAAEQAEEMAKRQIIRREQAKEAAPAAKDDLTRINGIGAVYETILQEAGIRTYAALSAASIEQLETIIVAAGRVRPPRLDSWPAQARYAAAGDWEGLRGYQASL